MTDYSLEPVEGDPFAKGYKLEAVEGDPFNKNTSLTGALSRGGENVANALGGLISETGKHIGGGKAFPKLMAKVASYLHDPNYQPGFEDAANPNASLGTRAAGVGRALVEGAPGMGLSLGAGAVAGPGGFLATQALLNGGNAIQGVRASDNVPEDQALNASQLARAGGAAAVDTGLNYVGAGKALAPLAEKAGLAQLGKDVLSAAATGGAAGAGQNVADRVLINGELPSSGELAASTALGTAAAGGARALKAIPEVPKAGEAGTFERFADTDPKVLAAAAKRLNDATGNYGSIKEGNAEDIRTKALAQSRKVLDFEARDQTIGGQNAVAHLLDEQSHRGNSAPSRAYMSAKAAVDSGEPVNAQDLTILKQAVSGDPAGEAWVKQLEEASAIAELGNMGHASGDGRIGGLRATPQGRSLDWLANKFGMGAISGGLAASAFGHTGVGGTAAAIGLGANALNLGVRGLDTYTGKSNPVGRFAQRFAEPPQEVSAPIQRVMQEPPATPEPPQPPPFPQTPPPVPTPLPTPGELKMDALIRAKYGKFPGPALGEDISAEPTRPVPPGADMEWRAPPPEAEPSARNLAKVDALVAKLQKKSTETDTSDAFKNARAATLAKRSSLSASRDRLAPKASQEPSQPRREAPRQEAPRESPMAEAVKPVIHTRKVGRGQHEVSVDESKIRNHLPNGEKDVDSFFNGVNERTLQKENFIDAVKNATKPEEHEKIDALLPKLMEHGVGMNLGRERFHAAVNKMKISAKRKADLKELFNHTEFGLNKSKYWGK